jgi:methylmalonyl-CoA mutase C-terminal domain/subunit
VVALGTPVRVLVAKPGLDGHDRGAKAYLGLTRKTVEALRASGVGDIKVVVGGTVPQVDVQPRLELGAAAVFPTSTSIESLVAEVRKLTGAVA